MFFFQQAWQPGLVLMPNITFIYSMFTLMTVFVAFSIFSHYLIPNA